MTLFGHLVKEARALGALRVRIQKTLKEFSSLDPMLTPHLLYFVPVLESVFPSQILVPYADGCSPAAQGLGITWGSKLQDLLTCQ